MKKKWLIVLLFIFIGSLIIISNYESPIETIAPQVVTVDLLRDTKGTYNDHSLILSPLGISNISKLEKSLHAASRLTSDRSYGVLKLPDDMTAIDVYENYPEYAPYFEIDYFVQTEEVETSIPNYSILDPGYDYQNEYSYMNIGNAWNNTLGQGITIAVIDTGIDTDHPEFAGKISLESYNASDDLVGIEYVEDEFGHGTAVAGAIAASFDGIGVIGIAPQVTLLIIKCDVDSNGNFIASSDLVFGIYYAIEKDVDVINMSFGLQVINPFEEALQLAVDSDIIPIAAAGNYSTSAPTYPASDPNAIGVGALAMNSYELASYSNYGENVKLVAPGSVYTTKMNGEYDYAHGTSFASPIVSGAVALYLSLHSNVKYDEIVDLLEASSVDLGQLGADWYYGFGALDVDALVCQEKGFVTFDYLTSEIENTSHIFVKGRPLQEFPEPERSMLVYDGWYFDIQTTDEIDYFTDAFSSNLTVYASWINEDEGIPYQYSYLQDGTIQIDGYYGKMRYLVIPNEIEGIAVTSIGINAFKGNQRLRQITLPNGLVNIQDHAFEDVNRLLEIKIPSSVKYIGQYAFAGNYRMGSVVINSDSNLESIGNFAFSQNVNLLRFDIPSKVSYVNGSTFYGCVSLREFVVSEDNVTYETVDDILYNELKTILVANPAALTANYVIPSTVIEIGQFAFSFTKRSSITLLDGLQFISNYAFTFANRLSTISIPSTVLSIGDYAFQNTQALYQVNFMSGSQLHSIGSYAFSWAQSLQSITIPSSVQSIGTYAFESSLSLSTVVFDNGSLVTSLSDGLFQNSISLSSITLPTSLTSVGDFAFFNAIRLQNLSLPNSVLSIGKYAFGNTWGLSSFISSDNLQTINDYAFMYSGINLIYIGDSISYLGEGVFGGAQNLASVLVSANNLSYKTLDGILYTHDMSELVAYPMGLSANAVIPSGVLSVGKGAFYGNSKLTSVSLPNTITHIKDYAFFQNYSLNNVTLPNSLTFIGEYAFSLNSSLTQITIPSLVNSVGRFAFNSNWNLTSIVFEANSSLNRIGFAAFAGTGITSIIIPANVSEISQGAFANSINLTTVTFAENSLLTYMAADIFVSSPKLASIIFGNGSQLSHIQAHAFDGITRLTSIDLSNLTMLTDIDNYAFFGCTNLSSVILPDSLERIGRFAFALNSSLSEISIPENINYIGEYAFYGTNSIFISFASSYLPLGFDQAWDEGVNGYLVNIQNRIITDTYEYAILGDGNITIIEYLGNESHVVIHQIEGINVTSIQPKAFENNTTLISISLPNTITVIPNGLFSGCTNLTTVQLGNSVIQIQDYAFYQTNSLTQIVIPSTVEVFGSYAFASNGLQNMTFEANSSLHSIGDYAFSQSQLTSLTLPSDVSYIGSYAFYRVTSLTNINLNTNVLLQIRDYAFFESGLTSLFIPSNVEYIGEFAFTANRSLFTIDVDINNPYYSSYEGVLYNKDNTKLITYPAGKSGTFTIPDSVKVLGFSAFEGSEQLTGVVFSTNNKIMSIGLKAFYGCTSLVSINIPDDIIHIGYYAFANNTSLEIVNISSQSQLTSVYDGAFYNDTNLTSIQLPINVVEIGAHAFKNTTSLSTLPYDISTRVVGIYDYAFADSAINSLVFPETLKEIGAHAFDNAEVGHTMTSLFVPSTVEYLGYAAFANFSGLEDITLPFVGSDKYNIDSDRFVYIFGSTDDLPANLHQVTFLEGIAKIPAHAFDWTTQIETVYLPDSVVEIGDYAFFVAGLKDIRLSENLQSIGSYAFYNFHGVSIYIPESVSYIGSYAFYGSSFFDIFISSESLKISWSPLWNFKDTDYKGNNLYIHYIVGNQSEVTIDDFKVGLLDDGTAIILKYTGTETNVVIPQTVSGHTVTQIASYAFLNKNENGVHLINTTIQSLSIPDTVNYIGPYGLANLSKLSSVVLPTSLISIEEGLLSNNYSLTEVILPEGVKIIDNHAFNNCYSLSVISLPNSLVDIRSFAFTNVNIEELYIPYNVEHIGIMAMLGTKRFFFKSNSLPPYLDDNWKNASSTIVLGASYLSEEVDFRYMILSNDTAIVTEYLGTSNYVIIPENLGGYPVKRLIDSLFEDNKTIEQVSIPSGVTELPPNLFRNASSLKTVLLPSNLLSIGEAAFLHTSLTELTLPESLISIGASAFLDSGNYESIILPNSLQNIGDSAFASNEHLTYISLPSSLLEIPSSMLYGNSQLASVIIPNTVKKIGGTAFANTAITSISLPDSLQSVGVNILNGTPLYNNQPDGLFIIDDILLNIIGILPYQSILSIPSNVFLIADKAFGHQPTLKEIYIPESVSYMGVSLCDNCYSVDKLTVPFVTNPSSFLSYNVPNVREIIVLPGAIELPNYSFSSFTNLEQITIPDTVTYVGQYVFYECSKLTRIEFLNPNINIEQYALLGCIGIRELVFPSSNMFNLRVVFGYSYGIPASLETVVLTEGSNYIPNEYLGNAQSLEKVVIPFSITSIDSNAFNNSPNVKLYFNISESAWFGISLDAFATQWLGQWSYVTLMSDNTIYSKFPLAHGDILAITNEPIKNSNDQFSYDFIGWDINSDGIADSLPSTIGGPLTLTAVYSSILNDVTVSFYTEDGSGILETVTVPYGTSITGPLPPSKASTPEFSYIFSHWSESIDPVMGNYNIYPIYDSVINHYTYQFYDSEGNVYASDTLYYGDTIPTPSLPIKALTPEYSYTFTGWSPVIPEIITQNISFYPEYSSVANEYQLTLDYQDGLTISSLNLSYSDLVVLPSVMMREGYMFGGWYLNDTCIDSLNTTTMPAYNLTLYAKWIPGTYRLDFINPDTLETYYTASFDYGNDLSQLTVVNPSIEGYTFVGWSNEIPSTMPANDLVFESIFQINSYDLTYQDYDGTILYTNHLNYQTDLSAITVDNPTRVGYTFTGWSMALPLSMPASNLEIVANYSVNQYTFSYVLEGTTIDSTEIYSYDYNIQLRDNPTKVGYTFAGWYLDQEFVTPFEITSMPNYDITIYAKWNLNLYQLSYLDLNNNLILSFSFYYGETISHSTVTPPTIEGYHFSKWNNEVPLTMPASNLIIKALYEPNSYYIEYVTNGGTALSSETYLYRDILALPQATGKLGYLFGGWYLDESLTTPFNGILMPASNLVLYAKWTINSYLLTFYDSNNSVISSQSVNYQDDLSGIIISAPSLTGYEFIGWDLEIPENMPAGNLDFRPVYQPLNYKIFYLNDDSTVILMFEKPYGSSLADVSIDNPIKTGHTFIGWSTSLPVTMPANDLLLTANYVVNNYGLVIRSYDGSILFTQNYNYGDSLENVSVTPIDREGYTFTGWSEVLPQTMPDHDINISSQYQINQYNLIYQDFDGVILWTYIFDYNTTLGDIIISNPSRTGYTFAGWSIELPNFMPAYDVLVTAQYQINQYVVTFENFDGSLLYNETFIYGESLLGINVSEPSRIGYTFTSWSEVLPSTMPANDININANYQINQYNITYQDYDGTILYSHDFDYGNSISNIDVDTPERTGYTFVSWSKSLPLQMPANDIMITATYQINQYNVTYEDYNGDILYSQEFDYMSSLQNVIVNEPSRIGYTFTGWSIDKPETMPANNLVLTATYLVNQYKLTFKDFDGTILYSTNYDYVSDISSQEIPSPNRTGYSFIGWSDTVPEYMPAEDITLEALYMLNKYAITYKDDNDNILCTLEYNYGTSLESINIANPSKVGYTFTGWSIDKPETMPANNLVITATYQVNQYKISYLDFNGTILYNQTFEYGTSLEGLTIIDPFREGYTFTSWSEVLPSTMPANDININANYQINQYNITYQDYDGTILYSHDFDYGNSISNIIIDTPERTGYTFVSWSKSLPLQMPANDIMISATYQINQYNITYENYNGDILYSQEFDYMSSLQNVIVNEPSRIGYTFTGWSFDKPETMPANNLVITATYLVNQYKISYLDFDGTILYSHDFDYGDSISNIIIYMPERTGYTFVSWSESLPSIMPAHNIIITPTYTIRLYTISYIDIDGKTMIKQDTSYYGDPLSPPEMNINYETVTHRYEFDGWTPSLPNTVTEDMIFTALLKKTIKISQEEANLITNQFTTVSLSDYAKLKKALSDLAPFEQYYPEHLNTLNNAIEQYRLLVANANEALEKSNLFDNQFVIYMFEQIRATDYAVLHEKKEEC